MTMTCPKCQSSETRFRAKRNEWICDDCDHRWTAEGAPPRQPLRIFLSYGHDEHSATALRIKADLEDRGHKVWFDVERLREGRDWEQYIEEGLASCDKVVLLMTPYSVRRRKKGDPESRDGYCLNEIAKAMEKNKLIVPVLLVSLDDGPPASICRIQYLDLRDSVPIAEHEERYQVRLERLAKAVEEDDLDFEGGQARLRRLLQPISFEADMSRHIASFTGRVWLLRELDEWLEGKSDSRVFWLVGGPGIGKTAVATHLSHFRSEVIGYHFCTHGHTDKADPARAVLSIAYQMAQHLPEYGRRLGEKDLEKDVAKNAGTLFDQLVVEPLSRDFPAPDGSRLVVIDALDEATSNGRNAIAELIRDHWAKTPPWLRLVITSRPELEVVSTLGHLAPYTLDAQRAENLADLERFLEREIAARGLPVTPGLIRTILDKSEGVFLYARVLFDEIDAKHLTLDRPEELPAGLYGHYHRFFSRQLPDVDRFRGELRPLLEIVCAGRAPVPVALLARALGASGFDVRERLMRLGALLNVRRSDEGGGDGDGVAPFHKSVRDWLTAIDERTRMPVAGPYVIDGERGEKSLADAVATELKGEVGKASAYALRHGPGHLVAAGRATDAAELMTDFGYHYARLERLGANDVVEVTRDFIALARARVPADQRQRLETWQLLHDENAHFLRRPGIRPEVELMQRAYGHADTSPVTRSVEAWLVSHDPRIWWFRKLGRPSEVVRSACLRVLESPNDVYALALHADGRRLVSRGLDKTVRVWDLDTGACLRTLQGHTKLVSSVALHADGRRAVTGSDDHTVRVWDLETGECLKMLVGHTKSVDSIALHADGRRAVSGSSDKTVRVWDLDTGACLRVLDGHTREVNSVATHADGRRAVSGSSDKTVRVWDLDTGACLRVLEGHTGQVTSLTLHQDGRRVLTADATVRVWDLETGACLRTLEHSVEPIALHADGRRAVTGSRHDTVRVWDLETGKCLRTLEGHTNQVTSLALHQDERRAVTGSTDNTLRVWDIGTGECLGTLRGHCCSITTVALHTDGRRAVTGSGDNTLRVWDIGTGASPGTAEGHTESVTAVAIDMNGRRVLTGSYDKTVRMWNPETGASLRTLQGHTHYVASAALHPDGLRAVTGGGDYDATVRVWDLNTGKCTQILEGHTGAVTVVALHVDGRRLLTGSWDRTVRVWDLDTGECLRTLLGKAPVRDMVLHEDRRRAVSLINNDTALVWDIETGACLRTIEFEGHTSTVMSMALHAGGRLVVTVSADETMRVWDLDTGACLRTIDHQTDPAQSVALHADGKRLVTRGRSSLSVWELETGTCLGAQCGDGAFNTVSLSGALPNGRARIVAGCEDGSVHFFELMPPGPLTRTTLATWSPTHALVATALDTGAITLHQWHASSARLEEIARSAPTGAPISSLRFSLDGTRLQLLSPNAPERILDATTLQPAAPPTCAWASARGSSPDGAWRADIVDGRLKIVAAT